jgi:hypothetical protein
MLPVTPCGEAAAAGGKYRVITHSEALDILAGRDAHEEDMEELVVGLMVVQIEFQACRRLFPAEATRSADRGNDLRMGRHWLELSGAS